MCLIMTIVAAVVFTVLYVVSKKRGTESINFLFPVVRVNLKITHCRLLT